MWVGLVLVVAGGASVWCSQGDWPGLAGDRLFPVLTGGKVGFIDATGRLVLPTRFDPLCRGADPRVDAMTQATPDLFPHCGILWGADFQEGRCVVRRGERMGHIDPSGRMLSQQSFDFAESFSDGLAVIRQGGRHGVIDRSGRIIVPARYSRIGSFRDGLAPVKDGRMWGIIDAAGRTVMPPRFMGVLHRDGGFLVVGADRKRGFVDRDGGAVVPAKFRRVFVFAGGIAVQDHERRWGLTDRKGRWLLRPCAEQISRCLFSEGLIGVKLHGRWRTIDRRGKTVSDGRPRETGPFSEGLKAVSSGGLYGYIDRSGREVIAPTFLNAGAFRGGLAQVLNSKGLWGCVDRTGKYVIPPAYGWMGVLQDGAAARIDRLTSGSLSGRELRKDLGLGLREVLRPGLFSVEQSGAWGIIDGTGKVRTPCVLDWPPPCGTLRFSEGRATVVYRDRVGYVDTEGYVVIRPRFDRADPFRGGLARVMVLDRSARPRPLYKWGYIDRQGEWVWKPTR